MKKVISIVLAVIFMCSALVGCDRDTSEKIEPTSELTIYVDMYTQGSLEKTISQYRYTYPSVKLNVMDFSEMDIWDFCTKLKSEVQAGKGPDVIYINDMSFDNIYKTVNSGVFYELSELIKNDEIFKMSDYNKVAMDAGVFDGKRYIMPVTIRIPFLMTTQSIIDETGIDINNCDNVIGIGKEINRCLKDNKDKCIFKDKQMIYRLSNLLGKDFVNYKTNNLMLDDKLIKEYFTLYKPLYSQDKILPNEIMYSSTFDGYNYLSKKQEVFECYDYGKIDEIFKSTAALTWKEEKPILLPIKTVDNKLQALVISSAAISNNSKNKINAFNFIKTMLSDNVQSYDRYPMDIPVRNESLDKRIIKCKTDLQEGGDAYFESEGFMFKSPEQSFFNEFSKALKKIERCTFSDRSMGYLQEYMTDFYEDKKSLDNCLKEAKDKLEIYISE